MTMYKLMAIAFIFLTLIFSYIIVSTFHLRRFGINLADIALPLFAVEIVLVSAKFYTHSFLAMSILSLILAIRQIRKRKTFSFRRFFKFFWRSGFILTFFFYLATVIAAFLAS